MSILLDVVYRNECRSTHHKLVIDGLRALHCDHAPAWRRVFLKHYEALLRGAKDPDDRFRDFRNHVLHARDNMWGGAPASAERWYRLTVNALRQGRWATAAYSFGVCSHYFTDALQPLHTAQSEAEAAVHRAAEWSVRKSYDQLVELAFGEDGLPVWDVPDGDHWLRTMMEHGATRACEHYDTIVADYDLAAGKSNPPAGLNDDLRGRFAEMIGMCVSGLAVLLRQAIRESGARPPSAGNTILGLLTKLTAPFAWLAQWNYEGGESRIVNAVVGEFQRTGRVRRTLPPEQREVRKLHAEQVLGISEQELDRRADAETPAPVSAERSGTESPAAPRVALGTGLPSERPPSGMSIRLDYEDPIVDAPSIGPKTAKRLERVGIRTVGDLMRAEVAAVVAQLGVAYITAELLQDWRAQAELACTIPELYGHDAQLLVASGLRTAAEVASQTPSDLLAAVTETAKSPDGQRILRGGDAPDLNEVTGWIQRARFASRSAA